jgi:2,5-dihydroxypyridine 5,6-dioxygenase
MERSGIEREMEMVKGVKRLVDYVMAVQPGEKVLIVTDTGMDPSIPKLFSIVTADRGADPVVMTMKPREFHGAQPPEHVAGAMKRSDVIFEVTSVFVGHGQARFDACDAGARYVTLPELDSRMLIGPAGLDCNFEAMVPMVMKLGEIVTNGKEIRLTTKKGTNLTSGMEGRKARALHGLLRNKGDFGPTPDIEVSVAPIEDATNGVLVVDGFIVGVGLIDEPVEITFKNGTAVEIKGGREAEALEQMLRDTDDPGAFDVCEVGLGLNPKANLQLATTLEAEGTYGTAHIALGGKLWPEAGKKAALHIDMVFYDVTYEVDGEVIVRDGDVVEEIKRLSMDAFK